MFGEIGDEVILKYNYQTPRYTSYPTAVNFKETTSDSDYLKWLKSIPTKEPISLYFHIPFCQQLCWYCGCYTKISKRYAPIEDYVYLLIREIKAVSDIIKLKNHPVHHIHFGGGSPTIILKNNFDDLMDAINGGFNIINGAEIAIEVDPRNLTEENIANYSKQKINRASIGVQDFNLEVQDAINRKQSFEQVFDCVRLFRKYGINDINLDLIYGLPKQTPDMIRTNIDYSLLLNPDRIALFSYAHVQWMKKHMRLIKEEDLPNPQDKLQMYKIAADRLSKKGYEIIGLDHFAKRDNKMAIAKQNKNLRRNFQGYSSDNANVIIAFGASAIGHLPDGYVQNTLNFDEYKEKILNQKLPVKRIIATSKEDKIRKKVIDEIMCYLEVDLDKISEIFKLDNNYFSQELIALKKLEKDNLIKINQNKIAINPLFPQITRIAASFFDQYPNSNKSHSQIA